MVYLIIRLPPGGSPLRIGWIEFLLHYFDVCGIEKVGGVFVGAVGGAIHNARNAGIDQYLGAVDAWQVSHITCGAFG